MCKYIAKHANLSVWGMGLYVYVVLKVKSANALDV